MLYKMRCIWLTTELWVSLNAKRYFFRYKIARQKCQSYRLAVLGSEISYFSMFVGIKGGEKDSPAAMIIFKTRDKICNM